jgi:hypothetical protein
MDMGHRLMTYTTQLILKMISNNGKCRGRLWARPYMPQTAPHRVRSIHTGRDKLYYPQVIRTGHRHDVHATRQFGHVVGQFRQQGFDIKCIYSLWIYFPSKGSTCKLGYYFNESLIEVKKFVVHVSL